ncbi:MAG: FHA domain-containing protein [Candidatus Hydrogenedentes bacterium]|nr:FHA domain-containing protein [Candidatus Hydrogenedentota bacterium]
MPSFKLVMGKGSAEETLFPVGPKGLVIGRSPDVDIVLKDQLVSRRHAWIHFDGSHLTIEDLGSRNGVLVNGARVFRGILRAEDDLVVGDTHFAIESGKGLSDSSSMISFENAGTLFQNILQKEGTGRLGVLYKAAQLLGSVFDLDDLLNQILRLIFDALPVKRGFILTLSPDSPEPVVRARLLTGAADDLPLSKTLIQHVFMSKSAVLTRDAQADERFDASASILGHAIRAAMCAPLCGREAIVGAIYVDPGNQAANFTPEDLELLTAIARVVGVAVENARLYKENVERERLAAIGEATAGVGHCVKNILTGVKGGEQFIDNALDQKDLKWLERGWPILRRSIERIETLVLNLLTFSRDRQPQIMPTDLNGLIEEVIEVLRHRAETAKVVFDFQRGDIGIVHVDGREIYRVLLNLLTNAVDACEENGGTITVTTYREPSGCYVEVSDTGAGIPPEIMPKLSQAFVSTKGSRGTGLGLACSYKIVREHGGDITCESEVGRGTTFTVCLPAATLVMTPKAKVTE